MKLIVGLGNPGKSYENTRHNVGYMVVDNFAEKYNLLINSKKFDGNFVEIIVNGEKVILLKPLLYMNLSGIVVRKYIDFYKININDVLIVSDDLDQQLGSFKLKLRGSSGGHNGLKNIEENLHTDEYKRLKIGISNNKNVDTKNYVLGHFNDDEKEIINDVVNNSVNILNDYILKDFESLMCKYNCRKG